MRLPLRATLWILALLLVAVPSRAAELGMFGFDVQAGVVPAGSEADTGYAVGFSLAVAELIDGLYLHPAVIYSLSETGSFRGDALESTSLAVGVEARYFLARERRGWYFGGGPYAHSIERDQLFDAGPALPFVVRGVSEDEFGTTLVAGYQFGTEGHGWLVEARSITARYVNGLQLLGGFSF